MIDVPDKEPLKAPDAKSDATKDSSQAPPEMPHSAAEEHSPPAPDSKCEAHKPSRDWLDYVEFIMGVVGLAVLITYTVYAGLQWCEMRAATRATEIAANAAKESADSAIRPWIGLYPPPKVGNNFQIEWSIRNYGAGVARRIVGVAYRLNYSQRRIWKQAESDEEHPTLKLDICKESVYKSADYDYGHVTGPYLTMFPQQQPSQILIPLEDWTSGQKTSFIAVCVAYQGVRSAHGLYESQFSPTIHIKDWLQEDGMFHTQVLYQVEGKTLTLIDADAYNPY